MSHLERTARARGASPARRDQSNSHLAPPGPRHDKYSRQGVKADRHEALLDRARIVERESSIIGEDEYGIAKRTPCFSQFAPAWPDPTHIPCQMYAQVYT
jgi:hypothetical protein